MVTICKPERVSIFINTNKLTMAQIKQQTGCDYIINGGLYNMSKLTPCCHLKSNGVIYSSEAWTRLGLGWNGLTFGMGYDMSKFDNYITCVELVNNGICQLSYPSDMGGARQRTAFGVFSDGRIWMYCVQSAMTIEQLQQEAISADVQYAICLDGGTSSQCILSCGTLTSSRNVYDYILVWKAPETKTIYRVQVGAYSNVDNAKKVAAQLQSQGYQTIIKKDVIKA